MEETKIEKLEEPKVEFNKDEFKKEILEEVKKTIVELLPKKEEMAEKKTAQKASNTNENKELLLQRQYRHLNDRAIKHLVQLKDNRKFIITDDGISVAEVEEKW